jgi:hypothetical protein
MATEETVPQSKIIGVDSHDTALCIIPPKHLWPTFDGLRSLYDKAYEKWPPHLNLVYPFVRVENISEAASLIASQIQHVSLHAIQVRLNAVDIFPHKHDNTIFIYDNDEERASHIQQLRNAALEALGHTSPTNHRMHLTIGQSQHMNSSPHKFLLDKAGLLPEAEWTVNKLYILTRERMQIDGNPFSQVKIWGTSKSYYHRLLLESP